MFKVGAGKMAKKKTTKRATKENSRKKKTTDRKTAKRRKPVTTEPTEMPTGRKSVRPFEVCNHFGIHLREIFEKEQLQNRSVQLGEIFEYLLRDLQGTWNMVNLYGKDTPLEKLRGESNPCHYDR